MLKRSSQLNRRTSTDSRLKPVIILWVILLWIYPVLVTVYRVEHFLEKTAITGNFSPTLEVESENDITFITVPKPLAKYPSPQLPLFFIKSWLAHKHSYVVLMTDMKVFDPENKYVPKLLSAYPGRLLFHQELPTGHFGKPLVREWFVQGQKLVYKGYLIFLNTDMFISEEWIEAALRVFRTLNTNEKTSIIGARTDVGSIDAFLNKSLDDSTFLRDATDYMKANFKENNPWGMDVYMIHSSFNAVDWGLMPPFEVGLCLWDNFVIGAANRYGSAVTFDFNPPCYHVEHATAPGRWDAARAYFTPLCRSSRIYGGLMEHRYVKWHLNWNNKHLRSRRRGSQLPLIL